VQKRGWRVTIASRARAWHQEGGTNWAKASPSYYAARNRLWFSRIWGNVGQTFLIWLWMATIVAPRILLADCFKRRSLDSTRSILHGLADGLMTLPSANTPLPDEPRPARWIRRR
jgi:hypothetical protein